MRMDVPGWAAPHCRPSTHQGGSPSRRQQRSRSGRTLEDRDADAAEEVPEALPESGPTGHRMGDPTTHCLTEFAVDQPVEERVLLEPQDQSGTAVIERPAVVDSSGGGGVEDLALPSAAALAWAPL